MIKLHKHQIDGKEMLRSEYSKKHKRLILCLPTGGGKTFTACSIVEDAVDKNEGSTLILVDRMELLKQWSSSLNKFEVPHRFIRSRAYNDSFMPSRVYVAMVESVWARMKKDPSYLTKLNIRFMITDECHKFAFMKILSFCFYQNT